MEKTRDAVIALVFLKFTGDKCEKRRREDIRSQSNMDLTVLLYNNRYPPEWDEEVFGKVMEQAVNFKSQGGYEYAVIAF